MSIPPFTAEEALLLRDKYDGDTEADLSGDLARLSGGEPLAYVIGWVPFLGLRIVLDSHPLIPRPETEWWTEELVKHLRERFCGKPFRLLDLCAGSGAIGLSVLHAFPHAQVSFGELVPEHSDLIRKNIEVNGLDGSRVDIRTGSLFEPFAHEQFDVIASNPPYVPESRVLEASVTEFEPSEALYAGPDGLSLIREIANDVSSHLLPQGEVWIECDMDHAEQVRELILSGGAHTAEVRNDLYGRPRLCVGYYS